MGEKLEIESPWSGKELVVIEINSYMNNKRIYIGLNCEYEDSMEPYGDVTVNIDGPCPDYCGYLDTNNSPMLEAFVVNNNLGEFTGIVGQSGFCSYPLYSFNVDRLRELCPDGLESYERVNGLGKFAQEEVERKGR